jgi:hypothetical protein
MVYRKNGKCVVDTNCDEDDGIYFEINHEKISLAYLLKLWAAHDYGVSVVEKVTGKKKNYGMECGAPEKTCDTCGHRFPLLGMPRFYFCCKDHSLWGGVAKEAKQESPPPTTYEYNHINERLDSLDYERRNHMGRIAILDRGVQELQKKVKVLEDQHRKIPKVPPIYPKPCYCKFPGQLPAVCLTFCASTECIYHKGHKG